MTSKSKKGAAANKSKKAAAAVSKPKAETSPPDVVVEVKEGDKVSAAEQVKAAPPPEAAAARTDQAAEQANGQVDQKKPTEEEAEAIAEQLVVEARKPIKKNDSQASLAGSVTVRFAALFRLNIYVAPHHQWLQPQLLTGT